MRKRSDQLFRFVRFAGVGPLVCVCVSMLVLVSTAQGRLPEASSPTDLTMRMPGLALDAMQDAQPVHVRTNTAEPVSEDSQPDAQPAGDVAGGDEPAGTEAVEDAADTKDDAAEAERTKSDMPSRRERVLRFFGRLHPVVVHFPIALLSVGALLEIVWVLFGKRRSRPSMSALVCVVFGALGAAVAAWYGWLNADFEPYGRGVAFTLRIHRWLGISTASLAAIAMVAGVGAVLKARAATVVAKKMDAGTAVYRVALVLAAIGVAITGHFGGELVYGSDYFSEVLFPDPPVPATATAPAGMGVATAALSDTDPELASWMAILDEGAGKNGNSAEDGSVDLSVDFVQEIAPIFANHCVKCHGPKKHKGDLRLDARYFVFEDRDADEQVIVPGDAQASELFWRISLPPNDEDAMPPEGKGEPLLPAQRALIEQWINEGAVWIDVPIIAPDE